MNDESVAHKLLDSIDEAHEEQQQENRYGVKWDYRARPRIEGLVIRRDEWIDKDKPEDDETRVVQIVEAQEPDGTRTSVFASPAVLRRLVSDENPRPGDRIGLAYYGERRPEGSGFAYGDFALIVKRGSQDEAPQEGVKADDDLGF
jgi:hypothetical protein